MSGKSIATTALWAFAVMLGASAATTCGGEVLADPAVCHCQSPDCCVRCGHKCMPGKLVAKTIMVPVMITETRLKTCINNVNKEFEVECTVFKREPITKTYKSKVCYLEDEVRSKVVETKCCARVKNPTVEVFDVEVPEAEVRYGPPPADPCQCGDTGNGDCPCQCAQPTSDCTCPACRGVAGGVEPGADCMRQVCVMKDQPRSANCEQEDVVFLKKSDVCSYCVKVPKYKEETCKEVTEYKLVPVTKKKKVTRCVPEVVKHPVEVQVTKMVPKTIYCCEACSKICK